MAIWICSRADYVAVDFILAGGLVVPAPVGPPTAVTSEYFDVVEIVNRRFAAQSYGTAWKKFLERAIRYGRKLLIIRLTFRRGIAGS
ncbi:MAG: hypothetical protein NW206_19100 [Hyphomonadaceae bacterium]|nr:hypothetical protein [Hyphomonadaceae bacterium]